MIIFPIPIFTNRNSSGYEGTAAEIIICILIAVVLSILLLAFVIGLAEGSYSDPWRIPDTDCTFSKNYHYILPTYNLGCYVGKWMIR